MQSNKTHDEVLWLRHKHTKSSGYVSDCDRDNNHNGKSRVYQQHQTEESCTLTNVSACKRNIFNMK